MKHFNQKILQWNESLTAPELAKLNGVSLSTVYNYASREGKKYKPRPRNNYGVWRKKNAGKIAAKSAWQRRKDDVKLLIKSFHAGNDEVIPLLAEKGIRASRANP